MSKEELKRKAAKLAKKNFKNISSKEDLVQEMNHRTMVHNAIFGRKQLGALELLTLYDSLALINDIRNKWV